MKLIDDEKDFFKKLMDMLEQQLGKNVEIVLHDLVGNYEHSIVDIRNGHITGREIGGFGSNLGLEVLSGTVENGDRFNYITKLKNHKTLRSSSLYIRDDSNKVIGSICINTDITETLRMENFLNCYNNIHESGTMAEPEIFVEDVNQLLEHILQEGRNQIGKPPSMMSREEKLCFLKYIESKGAFLIIKAGARIQEYLGISKYTMYNYLGKKDEIITSDSPG